jgi:TetR/AcrR family tetracycline transcriptional repressor
MKRASVSPLDREQITAVALELLKSDGVRSLTIRRLAEQLGIKSASLYHHFKDKQQLLDYVSAAMIAPAWRSPREDEPWQDWLIAIGYRLRAALNAYGDGAVIAAGSTPTPEAFRDAVALLYAPLLAAGFSQDLTRNVIVAVLRFVGGWTLDEQFARTRGMPRRVSVNEEGFSFGLRALVAGSELLATDVRHGGASE